MIEQQGQVVRIENGDASVRIGATSGCPACDAGKGCGAGVFGRLLQRKPATIRVENTIDARVGQSVIVGLPETVYLRLVLLLYALPLLSGLAGAASGHYICVRLAVSAAATDGFTLLAGVLAGAAMIFWGHSQKQEFLQQIAVYLLRAVKGQEVNSCSMADQARQR
jgi:sigma-E factor negative regulatory protein RseC